MNPEAVVSGIGFESVTCYESCQRKVVLEYSLYWQASILFSSMRARLNIHNITLTYNCILSISTIDTHTLGTNSSHTHTHQLILAHTHTHTPQGTHTGTGDDDHVLTHTHTTLYDCRMFEPDTDTMMSIW